MSDEDLANAFLWAPPGPVPDGVRLELHRRGLWRLLSPARKVCRLLLAAEPDAAALSAAARALPDATWHYLASHERVVGGATASVPGGVGRLPADPGYPRAVEARPVERGDRLRGPRS